MLDAWKKAEERFFERVELAYMFKSPDDRVDASWGIRYRCTQEEVDELQDRKIAPRNGGDEYMDVHAAVTIIRDRAYPDQKAYKRLLTISEDLEFSVISDNMIFKIFNDLDRVFFGNRLEHNVYLRLKFKPRSGSFGWTRSRGCNANRVCITINSAALRYVCDSKGNALRDAEGRLCADLKCTHLVNTLLHEMIHAFLYVLCGRVREAEGSKKEKHGRNKDGQHGVGFQTVLDEIQCRLNRMPKPWNRIDLTQKGYY